MPKSKEMISSSSGSDSENASSEEEIKKKSKARKPERKRKDESSASDNSESEENTKTKKRSKKQEDKGSNKKAKKADEDEETVWDIGGKKQVNVRNFKNKWFVDIREMYLDKDGELKPGKKGVCLNMDNWKLFMKIVEDVNKVVKTKCS